MGEEGEDQPTLHEIMLDDDFLDELAQKNQDLLD